MGSASVPLGTKLPHLQRPDSQKRPEEDGGPWVDSILFLAFDSHRQVQGGSQGIRCDARALGDGDQFGEQLPVGSIR